MTEFDQTQKYYAGLVAELCKHSRETEWVEFKRNNDNPQILGEYISALANAAALNGKSHGYLLWGIDNETHAVAGTTVDPAAAKSGNQPLESWLLQLLTPKVHFAFTTVHVSGLRVVVLEVGRALTQPVKFKGTAFIRIGEVKKPLIEAPSREAQLWRVFDTTPFENLHALEQQTPEDVLRLLDYPAYFDLAQRTLPSSRDEVLHELAAEDLIVPCEAGGWDITNLGAILFARSLSHFPKLSRKAMRVVQYSGSGRIDAIREQIGGKGYANGFEGLISFVNALIPVNEVIGQALRETVPMFPELAVRELVANALIHQDFCSTGTGPMLEIFTDRIEITNPGEPLIDPDRFLDSPPRSRNEALASLMRRMGICEERGSGIDKVLDRVEFYQLPAPLFERPPGFTRVVLFAHKAFNEMDRTERVRACYLHACLCWVTQRKMTNATLRERFGIAPQNAAIASRVLKESLEAGAVHLQDHFAGTRTRSYIPWWVAGGEKPTILT